MKYVIGIDPSLSSTAVVALRDTGVCAPQLFTSKPPTIKNMAERIMRAERLAKQVTDWVYDKEPELIVIEGYSYGSPNRAHGIGEFGGLLRARLLGMFDPPSIVESAPKCLKLFACGKGNANKLAVATALVKRYGIDFGGCDDLYDAFGLAKLAACVVGWDKPANEGQRKAVATMNLQPNG